MNAEELKERTKQFAHRSVRLGLALPNETLGNHIRRQLIRCATSVASNYRAACLAQSRADFAAKLSIVIEESDESAFWMEFLLEEHLQKEDRVGPLLQEAQELTAIFVAARKTTKDRTGEFRETEEPPENNQ